MKRRVLISAVVAAALTATPAMVPPAGASTPPKGPTVTHDCFTSVPDPGSDAPVEICYSVFKPAGASKKRKVPLLLHSHGWGGSRAVEVADVERYLDAGYGVLSFDQRGFGDSGGRAHVENPDVEGHDVRRLVRTAAKLRWVRKDGRNDPRMGAVGGSYGGAYQYLAAFEMLRTRGKPVLDALAPEITWNDLQTSLAPEGVVRTEWALALSAAAVPSDSLPPAVYGALVEGAATGNWPDGDPVSISDMNAFFEKNGPAWHVRQGRKLGIPVLMGQGATDSLFNLREGLVNWRTALTKKARKRSIFVGYNGGHVLPGVLPQGVEVTSDPCSEKLAGGDFTELAIRFFDEKLKGRDTGLRGWGKVHLGTQDSTCTTRRTSRPTTVVEVGTVASPAALVAPPLTYELAQGPIRIAGESFLTADVTTTTVDGRAFLGFAVGTSPLDARLVQKSVLPLNEPMPVQGVSRRVTLPSVAVDVPAGQNLYLLAAPTSDTFVGMSSRVPGAVLLDATAVHLPVVK